MQIVWQPYDGWLQLVNTYQYRPHFWYYHGLVNASCHKLLRDIIRSWLAERIVDAIVSCGTVGSTNNGNFEMISLCYTSKLIQVYHLWNVNQLRGSNLKKKKLANRCTWFHLPFLQRICSKKQNRKQRNYTQRAACFWFSHTIPILVSQSCTERVQTAVVIFRYMRYSVLSA